MTYLDEPLAGGDADFPDQYSINAIRERAAYWAEAENTGTARSQLHDVDLLIREIQRLRAAQPGEDRLKKRFALWLVAIGYGLEFTCPGHPLPDELRLPLAKAWRFADTDGPEEPEAFVEDYYNMLAEECGWDDAEVVEADPRFPTPEEERETLAELSYEQQGGS
jgi:hypothetical protein